MARWHLTLALSATAIAALLIAPRLTGLKTTPVPDVPDVPVAATPAAPAAPAIPAGALTVTAGLDHDAVLAGETRFLAITVDAPVEGGQVIDRPVDLSVVIDASGSMSARGKIDYARQAAKLLASSLDEDDRFSLVTFADGARTLIPAVAVTDVRSLHRAIDGIYEGGGTNLYAGLEHGSAEVRKSIRPGMVGRVVVLSDGHANVGLTSARAFEQFAAETAGNGVSLSAVGLGRDYNEDLLARLSDIGGGSYDYVDDPRELADVLSDELSRTASVVARGVSVKVQLPQGVEPLDVLGWDATRDGNGWNVWLGDVYAGETRKIVTRVRVLHNKEGAMHVADVQADYHDLLLDASAQSTARASATLTSNRRVAAGSAHRERAIASQRAYGAWHLEKSARYWEAGNAAEAQQVAAQGQAVLQQASIDFDDDDLADEAEILKELGYAAGTEQADSHEGKGRLKAAKEDYRALAR